MKKFSGVVCLLLAFVLGSCNDTCRVEGKMSDIPEETTVYMLRRTGEFTFDTIMQTVMKEGAFQLELPRELWGEQYNLKFGDRRGTVAFFAEQGNIVIEGSGKTIYDADVKGSLENDRWNEYQKLMWRIGAQRNRFMREMASNQEPDSIKRVKYESFSNSLDEKLMHYKDSLAQADATSITALFLYYQSLPLLKYDQIDRILEKFTPQLVDNKYYQEMKVRADLLRKVAPGVNAPDFEVKTVDGGSVKLSSFRGKYLILDFWASWCAPCREETVYIKELYNKYHDAGLEVFSVSLDDKKDAWIKAIEEDGMTWNHGCQLLRGGKNTPVAQLYGIDGIPAIWVIDPEGKILAQGLQREKLVEFCSRLFEGK